MMGHRDRRSPLTRGGKARASLARWSACHGRANGGQSRAAIGESAHHKNRAADAELDRVGGRPLRALPFQDTVAPPIIHRPAHLH